MPSDTLSPALSRWSLLWAMLAGATAVLSFAPLSWWPVQIASLAVLLWLAVCANLDTPQRADRLGLQLRLDGGRHPLALYQPARLWRPAGADGGRRGAAAVGSHGPVYRHGDGRRHLAAAALRAVAGDHAAAGLPAAVGAGRMAAQLGRDRLSVDRLRLCPCEQPAGRLCAAGRRLRHGLAGGAAGGLPGAGIFRTRAGWRWPGRGA